MKKGEYLRYSIRSSFVIKGWLFTQRLENETTEEYVSSNLINNGWAYRNNNDLESHIRLTELRYLT